MKRVAENVLISSGRETKKWIERSQIKFHRTDIPRCGMTG